MKRTFSAICLCVIFLLNSCAINESINFFEDETFDYNLSIQLSEPLQSAVKNSDESKDTLIYFSDLIQKVKDTIDINNEKNKKAIEVMESMKDYSIEIKSMEETGFQLAIKSEKVPFTKYQSMQKIMENLQELNNWEKGKKSAQNPFLGGLGPNKVDTEFSIDKNKFTRQAILPEGYEAKVSEVRSQLKKEFLNNDEFESVDDLNQALSNVIDSIFNMKYKVKYSFPYSVKSISNSKAVLKDDGKTVEIDGDFYDSVLDPEKFNIEVEFKK